MYKTNSSKNHWDQWTFWGSFWTSRKHRWILSRDWDLDSIFSFNDDLEYGPLNQPLNLLPPTFFIYNRRVMKATIPSAQSTMEISLYSLCSRFLGRDSLRWAAYRPAEEEIRYLCVWRELPKSQAKRAKERQGHSLETRAKKVAPSIAIVFFLFPCLPPIFLSQIGEIGLIRITRGVLKVKNASKWQMKPAVYWVVSVYGKMEGRWDRSFLESFGSVTRFPAT